MNKKILILGANGLIGSGLTSYLSTKKINLFLVVKSKKRSFPKISNIIIVIIYPKKNEWRGLILISTK